MTWDVDNNLFFDQLKERIKEETMANHHFFDLMKEEPPVKESVKESVEKYIDTCAWVQNDDGVWETSCSMAFEFTVDGPKANHFLFCPYCGDRISAFED